jgi:predicted double-glycine peptidase
MVMILISALNTKEMNCSYYKISVEHIISDWGREPTFWLEVNMDGDAVRQVVIFPNGNVLKYDLFHQIDEYDALQQMVVDGDEEWWKEYIISRDEFEQIWNTHTSINYGKGERQDDARTNTTNLQDLNERDLPF